jgi:hypothetical protein
MKDMQAHLETLRANIDQCERLHRDTKSKVKRDVFARLVARYKVLAGELERAIAEEKAMKK